MVDERVQRRLVAILAVDVVGYSRLMEYDEAGTLARLKALRCLVVDPAVARHGGRVVKLMGDGALVEFASAVEAVTCAMEIQRMVPEQEPDAAPGKGIRFRIGINLGDVIVDGDDIYGDGVNVAARIEALAEPGGIYISRAAADQVRDKIPVAIESCGSQTVKNIARPIEIFALVADRHGQPRAAHAAARAAAEKASIAILAFTNMSGDPDQEYFSDGIAEDIITDLAKLSDLHVIARNSSFVYKASAVAVSEVARTLGVRYVLEGSVRKAGNRVRVTAQLIDATTSGHVWADRYDRDLTDIFAVQDELTREIVAALKLKLTRRETERIVGRRFADIEAYNYFLLGREQVWLHTRSGNKNARALMAKVSEMEPSCAAAPAFSAFTLVNDYVNGWAEDPDQALATGLDLAERAVAMDDEDADAHLAMGVALLWSRELDRAFEAAARCLALKPNGAEGLLLRAHVQNFNGDAAEALETLERYMLLDPHYPEIALQFLAESHFSLGRFEVAAETLRRRMERNPDSATAHALLASCYGHLGRIEEGRSAWAQVAKSDPAYSVERRRRVLPFRNPAEFEKRVDGLRRLGLDF